MTRMFATFAGITQPKPEQEVRAALFFIGLLLLLLLGALGLLLALLPLMKVQGAVPGA